MILPPQRINNARLFNQCYIYRAYMYHTKILSFYRFANVGFPVMYVIVIYQQAIFVFTYYITILNIEIFKLAISHLLSAVTGYMLVYIVHEIVVYNIFFQFIIAFRIFVHLCLLHIIIYNLKHTTQYYYSDLQCSVTD